MLIDTHLAHDIDLKVSKVIENPQYYLKRAHGIKSALGVENKRFSWWIEHPDVRRGMLVTSGKDRGELVSRARTGIGRLSEAWHYLSPMGNFAREDVIQEVARLADPHENQFGYRQHRVSLGLKNYSPPNPAKVPQLVEEAFAEYQGMAESYHVIEKAAILHLRLAGIQPFPSANKRVARLYQEKVLYDGRLPPAVIPAGERETYIDLLEGGLVSLRDRTPKGTQLFCNFIGGKVNSALDKILNDLKV